jgi:hypothetical protein
MRFFTVPKPPYQFDGGAAMTDASFVYIIGSPRPRQPVKIGYSTDPEQRLDDLRPRPIRLGPWPRWPGGRTGVSFGELRREMAHKRPH